MKINFETISKCFLRFEANIEILGQLINSYDEEIQRIQDEEKIQLLFAEKRNLIQFFSSFELLGEQISDKFTVLTGCNDALGYDSDSEEYKIILAKEFDVDGLKFIQRVVAEILYLAKLAVAEGHLKIIIGKEELENLLDAIQMKLEPIAAKGLVARTGMFKPAPVQNQKNGSFFLEEITAAL